MPATETQNCTLLAIRRMDTPDCLRRQVLDACERLFAACLKSYWSINQLPVRTSRWQSHRHQSTSEGRPHTPMHGDGTVCPP